MQSRNLLLISLGLILGIYSAFAQSVSVHLIIREASTKQPLAYATVYSAKLQTGQYSREDGMIEWTLSADDTITVSFLSCETQRIAVKSLINTHEVLLRDTPYALNAVIVKSLKKRRKSYYIGFYDDPTYFDGWGVNIGNIAVNNIYNNTEQVGRIKAVLVDLGKAKKQPHRAKARIRVFEVGKSMRGPGKDLLSENIIFNIPKFSTSMRVDVSQYNIIFPLEGLFIGIEFLGFETKEGFKTNWKLQSGANVTSTKRDDYRSVGVSWKYPDSAGKPRWVSITDGSEHKAWERSLFKIGAEIEAQH